MPGPIRRMTLLLSVCPFKTSPCVRFKRPRVYRHHAHMLKHMCACWHTRGRFERTHGDVLNLHTEVTQRHTQKTHTQDTHGHTHRNTQHAGPKQDKNNDFRTKNDVFFFLTHRKMSFAQSHFFQMVVAGRPARARAAGAPWTHNVA